jgi:hypothetical protein
MRFMLRGFFFYLCKYENTPDVVDFDLAETFTKPVPECFEYVSVNI